MQKYQPVNYYYVAKPSFWPLIGSIGLFSFMIGFVNILHKNLIGTYFCLFGFFLVAYMLYGWFRNVINESLNGLHSDQMDYSYRWGMFWFISSEIAFFGIFFIALFYARFAAVPTLGGNDFTHQLLWPQFHAGWPLLANPNPKQFPGPQQAMEAWGIPALNTLILLTSAATITVAHWGLKKGRRWQLLGGIIATIVLGLIFLFFQVHEYILADLKYNLTLNSGIYGTTFFMLTGFHGAHVTIGLTMLIVILIRAWKQHFQTEHHFAFEAVSWYWHFVDVVWLFLFVFVYWL